MDSEAFGLYNLEGFLLLLLWDVHKEFSISPKNTKGIIYELHRRSINIQMDFAYSSLSNNEREQFDQVIERIHSKIENYLICLKLSAPFSLIFPLLFHLMNIVHEVNNKL